MEFDDLVAKLIEIRKGTTDIETKRYLSFLSHDIQKQGLSGLVPEFEPAANSDRIEFSLMMDEIKLAENQTNDPYSNKLLQQLRKEIYAEGIDGYVPDQKRIVNNEEIEKPKKSVQTKMEAARKQADLQNKNQQVDSKKYRNQDREKNSF